MLCAWWAIKCPILLPPVTRPNVLCSPGGTWLSGVSLPTWWNLVLRLVATWPVLVLVRVPVPLTRPLVNNIVLEVWVRPSILIISLLWLDTICLLAVHNPVTLTRFLVSWVVCRVIPGLIPAAEARNLVIVRAEGMVRPMTCACEWTAGSMLRVSGVYSS